MFTEAEAGEANLCGIVEHLHEVLLVSHPSLPGSPVARTAPELVPGLEVVSLRLVLRLLPSLALALLLLHLTAELTPVLLLVLLNTLFLQGTDIVILHLAVPGLDRLLGGVLGDVRAGEPGVLHVPSHRVLAGSAGGLGLHEGRQLQSDLLGTRAQSLVLELTANTHLASHGPVLLQPLVLYLHHLSLQRIVLSFLHVKLPLSGVSRGVPALERLF